MRIPAVVVPVLAVLLLVGCGSSGSSGPSGSSVHGVVYAPNGVDPVPGAEVVLSDSPAVDAFGNPLRVLARASTGPDGRFTVEGVPEGTANVFISSGLFRTSFSASVAGDGSTALSGSRTTLPAATGGGGDNALAPRFAVVTNEWDEMSNVLAKFGMGQVDDNGALVLGTEQFDIYIGGGGRDGAYYMVWNPENEAWDSLAYPDTYPLASELFADLATMRQYDVIVINCGTADGSILQDPEVAGRIHDFVQQGGRLYVTDRSYDFIEQVFPNYIRFQNGGDLPPSTPEPMDAGEAGVEEITSDATIRDSGLSGWLSNLGVLNPDGSVRIEDFLYRWAVMVGPHVGTIGSQCKVWVEGLVRWYAGEDDTVTEEGVRPLTVSFHYGTGKVIYTSYHTAGSPHAGFTPQERILEYLLFEAVR